MGFGFEIPLERPLARLAAQACIGGAEVPHPSSSYAPPLQADDADRANVPDDAGDVCHGILRGLLLGDDLSPVRGRLAPEVVAWSPSLFVTSRDLLLVRIAARRPVPEEAAGHSLSEVSLVVTSTVSARSLVCAEWRLTARFTAPAFVDDDLMIEPTGRLLETAGALVVAFHLGVVASIRCYHDDLALLEQLIASG
jgi:hypothetical protein